MSSRHVVVDGSNIATEGRNLPNLGQLDQAVREFLGENPDDIITVVVDASFAHRIDASELPTFEEAEMAGEVVSPPAGAIGRGDAFLLRIAEKTGATVLSNDSFQEFHGEHEWLFERGRLIGGKPVPGVGWIFTPRTPVRGIKSREAVKEAKRKKREDAPESPATGLEVAASRAKGRVRKVDKAIATATEEVTETDEVKRKRRRGGRETASDPVNEPLVFITFIAAHPLGSEVTGTVEVFSSHGAYIDADGARCYLPLSAMGDPAPRSAREVLTKGDSQTFVIQALDPLRRGIELALPGFARIASGPTEETIDAEIHTGTRQSDEPDESPAPARRSRKRAGAAATAAVSPTDAPAPVVGQSAPAPAPVVGQSAPAPVVGQSAPAPVVGQSAPAAGPRRNPARTGGVGPAAGSPPKAEVSDAPVKRGRSRKAPVPASDVAAPSGYDGAGGDTAELPAVGDRPSTRRRRRSKAVEAPAAEAVSAEAPSPEAPAASKAPSPEAPAAEAPSAEALAASKAPRARRAPVVKEAPSARRAPAIRKAAAAAPAPTPASVPVPAGRKRPATRKVAGTNVPAALQVEATTPVTAKASASKASPSKALTTKALASKASASKAPASKAPASKVPASKVPASKAPITKVPASKVPAQKALAGRAPAGKAPASKASASKAPAKKAPATGKVEATAPPSTRKASASKASASKAPSSKASASKAPASKAPASKAPASKASASKAPATKAPAKRTPARRAAPPSPSADPAPPSRRRRSGSS
jgi:hypothetical protein